MSRATGSTTPTGTPDRSHTSLVNAAASKPRGNLCAPALLAGRGGASVSAGSSCWSVWRFVTVRIPERCATQTTTCCACAGSELLYVDFEFHRVMCGRWESQPPVPANFRNRDTRHGGADSTPPDGAPESGAPGPRPPIQRGGAGSAPPLEDAPVVSTRHNHTLPDANGVGASRRCSSLAGVCGWVWFSFLATGERPSPGRYGAHPETLALVNRGRLTGAVRSSSTATPDRPLTHSAIIRGAHAARVVP